MKTVKKILLLLIFSFLTCVGIFYGMDPQAQPFQFNFPDYFLSMPSAGMTQYSESIDGYKKAIAYAQQHLLSRPIVSLDTDTFLKKMCELHKYICPNEKPGYIRTKEISIIFDLECGTFEKALEALATRPNGEEKVALLKRACKTTINRYGSMDNGWSHLTREEQELFREISHIPPMPQEVNGLLKAMVEKLNDLGKRGINAIEIAAYVHKEITCIHPFKDGNGRTARLLMNLILIQNKQIPVIFLDDAEYTQKVKEADKNLNVFTDYLRQRMSILREQEPTIKAPTQEEIENYYKKQQTAAASCICGKSSSQHCGNCKQAHYCSRECQRADWPKHKQICKPAAK